MKRIQYGLSIITIFSGISIRAMDDKQLSTWATQIEKVAGRLPALADHVSMLSDGSLSPVAGQTMNVPTELQALRETLQATACEMRATQKIPLIEEAIIEATQERFEWEVKFLRPGNANEAGKDRKYISRYLHELFQAGQIPENKTPYIPHLIDHMLQNRSHNEGARITLERARLASEFHAQAITNNIITPILNEHLQGMQGGVREHIIQKISRERGCRYFALQAVHEWLREQEGDDEDSDDEQDDDTQAASSSKRTHKRRALEGEDGKPSKK